MTRTIEEALSPLLIVGSFCSLCLFEYPLGKFRPYLNCLYIVTTWSAYAYILYYLLVVTNTMSLFLTWTNIIIIISTIVSMFVSLFRFKELKACLCKLSMVDDTLEVLGMPKEYQLLHNSVIRITIGWIVALCILNTVDIMWLSKKHHINIAYICIPFVANHSLHVSNLSGLIWGTILRYTGSRFQRLNEYIYDLLVDNTERTHIGKRNVLTLIDRGRIKIKEYKQRHIWTIMHVHLQLSHISRELNKVFSMQMTLEVTILYAFLVGLFVDFYDIYTDDTPRSVYQYVQNAIIYMWTAIYIVKLIGLNYICQVVCDKATETMVILYKLINESSDENLREQSLQFILQIKRREIKFTGMGLFYFGYIFIHKFFSSVLTILVIIIQMRPPNHHTNKEHSVDR